ncbi:hypothetical protein E3N88_32380 [Mikania micrantha]|uniref:Uncharacterized protein n=1 Tax=Mikania micrantha TaxID=192012 RepID=A0A5N6M9M1_9ASTR|nr:hypothetical protein E3N88_32380 [Mikania micrantha]
MDPTRVAANGTDLLNTVSHPSYMSGAKLNKPVNTHTIWSRSHRINTFTMSKPFIYVEATRKTGVPKIANRNPKMGAEEKGRHGWRKEKVKKFSARCEAGMEKRGREHQKG